MSYVGGTGEEMFRIKRCLRRSSYVSLLSKIVGKLRWEKGTSYESSKSSYIVI